MTAALDWRTAPVPFIAGLADTRLKSAQSYAVRPLREIMAESVPARRPKNQALAFLPSLYAANDARSHAAQRERGQFVALVGDVDEGDHSLAEIGKVIDTLAVGPVARSIYSTASAVPEGKRWRLIVPLASVLSYDDWRDAQLALVDLMTRYGIKLDTCAARPGQISYLPNVPDDARAPDGSPWFFDRAADLDAPGLDISGGVIAEQMKAIRTQRAVDDAERERIKGEAFNRRARRPISSGDGGSMIESFNRDNSVATLLERYGYERSPRHSEDWRSPFQTSGSYATRVIEGDKWISLSGSDAAAGLGEMCAAGCFGDAFDLFVHFEQGGDRTAALRQLHREREASAPAPASEAYDPDTGEVIEGPWRRNIAPEPVDLWQHYGAPELPQGLLPEGVERFARAHADIMGVDPAGLAMATLCVCAATIPDSIKLQVKRHDPTWCESARLWVGLVGSPSMKKTPIMSAALRPLKRIDSNLMRAFTEKRQQYDALTAKERKEADRPKQERRIISDATVEAAQEVLRDSPRGVLSAQDELSGWFGQMDKYAPGKGSQADRGFWLQAFNGGSYSLNRIARGASYIPNCSISLLGGIQPEPMRAIANDTHDDGLVQRMLPVILRPGRVGRDVPADGVLSDYERLIERLEVMRTPQRSGAISYGESASPLRLSDDARAVREQLEQEHLDLVRALESVSPKLAAHFGKYDGLFARLCVLWHCVDHCEQLQPPAEVSGDTARRVAAFMERFLRPSAIAFYAGVLGLSAGHERLVDLATWIVGSGVDEVKPRDVQGASQSFRHVTADEVRLLCEKLEAFGWGEWTEPAAKSNRPRFVVNPRVHDLFADRGRAELERRAAARDIIKSALSA